ncbi:uncharacterized protein RAG0_03599 [Rhynchosporium agropyri]|uniref:Uncharacterized protein n=1 Tax=Rhynchosporium agropyri TaxID=914238 RepID=A0A1E1K5P6_9HELO|nr:uncharacterized protein RAG0_03599 [Rhynchosporium agropyri]
MICPHLLHAIGRRIEVQETGIVRCSWCRSEFRATPRTEKNRLGQVLTVWKDFGSGADDEIWEAHLPLASTRMRRPRPGPKNPQTHEDTGTQDYSPSSVFGSDDGDDLVFSLLLQRENSSKISRWVSRLMNKNYIHQVTY